MSQEVRFSDMAFPQDWDVPSDCMGQLLVGGLEAGVREAYYLLDFDNHQVRYCSIDISAYAHGMTRFLESSIAAEHLPYGIRSHDSFVYNFAQPHEGLRLEDGRIVIGMHNASYFRELSFEQQHAGTFQSDAAFRPVMLSAQNSLSADGTLYFYAQTSLEDRLRRYVDRSIPLRTQVSCANVATGAVRKVGELSTGEAVHEAKLTPDESRIMLTEFSLVARANPPESRERPFEDVASWAGYESGGLDESNLYCVDRDTGHHAAMRVSARTPGHIEFSAVEPDRFYLSCHNLSKAHGKVILHGTGELIAGRVAGTAMEECHRLTSDEVFRVTSHKVYEYGGSHRIALTVFPNRLYILSDPELRIIENVQLFPHECIPAHGLYFCTLLPHMPIWLDASDNKRYVILVANQSVYLFDQQTSTLRSFQGYSYAGNFAGTAHVTNLSDFAPIRVGRMEHVN